MRTKKYRWVQWPAENCPNCGSHAAHVYTQSDDENELFDGDAAECKDCGHKGQIIYYDWPDIAWDEL